jgi:putative membrane-bound dehydrogenase-like protein
VLWLAFPQLPISSRKEVALKAEGSPPHLPVENRTMKRSTFLLAALLVVPVLLPGLRREAAGAREVQLNGHTFTLPEGFEIELVAGPPLVDRPIEADFDEQGRLYVTDSSGSNDKVEVQLEKKPHRVVRLEDTKGDGHFDKATVFADKLMFPEGAMWYDGSLYVGAPPSIWKLTDTDGDGVADQRSEWFQGKTLTGCANDMHGPYLGPDGWIYWCKGAFAKQTYERPGRSPFVTRAAHIFRCRPDGSGLEPVMNGGMDNPVEVVFTPGGERIFTTTFFQHPGGGQRDGLIHAIYGGVYGKDHDVIYEHKWTSPRLMPVLTHLGPAAPAGLLRYEGSVFGPEYQDNLFATLFNMQKVTRHILEPVGATFQTRDQDFLVSTNRDFHPTDVLEDADGSLLVIDTGGWYKLCCPTSQLHKPDVLGGIYRIRRTGAPRVEDPRGLKLDWPKLSPEELAKLLDDPRPAVRKRAVAALAGKGAAALPAIATLLHSPSVEARRNAIWAATRLPQPEARAAVRTALADGEDTVRQVALHSISLWRDREAVPQLVDLLKKPSAHNRRAAAEALGRIGDRSAVPALMDAVGQPAGEASANSDQVLQHSLTYALIEIADGDGTAAGLTSANPRTRRAALVALDQMDGGRLDAQTVARELTSAEPMLREIAVWIVGRHPEWGGDLVDYLRGRISAKEQPPAERDELANQLARFAGAPAVQELLASCLRDAAKAPEACRTALGAIARSNLKKTPAAWLAGLTQILTGDDADLVREAVATARALPTPKVQPEALVNALLRIGADAGRPEAVRLTALAAVPGGLTDLKPELFAFLRQCLDKEQPVVSRALAADVLSRARLSADQLIALARALKTTAPMEVNRLLDAFTQTTDEQVGLALLAALSEPEVRPSVRPAAIKPCLEKYSPAVHQEAEKLYAILDVDLSKQRAKLDDLLTSLKDGDIRRGQAVFNSAKAACSSCHTIGYMGGKVGPDLTRVGQIRSERDLLESIVFPSASFVRSYEPVLVTTKRGKTYNGVLKKDAPDEVVLALNATEEARIARDDIEEMQLSTVSVMPAGLDQQLTPRDLADLVAFLRACK